MEVKRHRKRRLKKWVRVTILILVCVNAVWIVKSVSGKAKEDVKEIKLKAGEHIVFDLFENDVEETNRVDVSYFDDAVFIGDSRVEGFILNNALSNTTAYTQKGLNVNGVFNDLNVNLDGELVSMMEACQRKKFNKVYLMLGINEMGWVYSDLFIDKYEEIISELQTSQPNAIIYVQSILPVSNEVSNTHDYISNDRIREFNELLKQMAYRKQVNYVNVYECMVDENECLPEEAAFDGIHLKKEYCEKWLEYLLTHVKE